MHIETNSYFCTTMVRLILSTDFTESFAHHLLKGILEYSKKHEPWVVCKMPPAYREYYGIDGVLSWAKKWKADAIISQFENDDPVGVFRENGIIAIAQDYKSCFTSIPNITSNYRLAGYMAADFFINKGFRNFAFYGYKDAVWSDGRCEGFLSRITEKGFGNSFYEYRENFGDYWHYESTDLADWLKSLPRSTALLACDDSRGNRITEICRVIGIRIPEELAVLGVDDDELSCNLSDPPLSSIHMNVEKGGYEAAKLIDRLREDRDAAYTDVFIEPTKVVNRFSTDIYSTTDPHVLAALQYIHQNLASTIKVFNVVNQVPLSRRLLEVRFKQVTGVPVYQYIFNLRMERFAQLLLDSDDPIIDVAASVGLTNYKNLARQFELYKECTPSEYRKKHRMK